jgi:hypothetical protein
LAAFGPIGRCNKVGDGGLYSLLVGVSGLEDDEYAPEVELFVHFAKDSVKPTSHLGSSFNNLHASSNVKFFMFILVKNNFAAKMTSLSELLLFCVATTCL